MDLQPYDVLQVSRDNGETWLDFSMARRYVAQPRLWATQEGASAWNYRFRVIRGGTGQVVLRAEDWEVDE